MMRIAFVQPFPIAARTKLETALPSAIIPIIPNPNQPRFFLSAFNFRSSFFSDFFFFAKKIFHSLLVAEGSF